MSGSISKRSGLSGLRSARPRWCRSRPHCSWYLSGVKMPAMVLLLFIGSDCVPAQEAGSRAVLDTGPNAGTGLVFLRANALEYFEGEYTIGEARIRVYYSESRIAESEIWGRLRCDGNTLRVIQDDEEVITVFVSEEGWTIFLEYSPELGDICPFFSTFLRRFRYFLDVGSTGGVPPFPAILDIR